MQRTRTMAEATQEMIALARKVAANTHDVAALRRYYLDGTMDSSSQVRIALAAIQATTERAANLADGWLGVDFDESANCMAANIRDDLLANAHLKEQSA